MGSENLAMTKHPWQAWVLEKTESKQIEAIDGVQTLWGGYGDLLRIHLQGGSTSSVILKKVSPPEKETESLSDRRKRRSYEVESMWYERHAQRCHDGCRVATFLGTFTEDDARYLLLEDLRESGFHRVAEPSSKQTASGLSWLAHFHALFMGEQLEGLWEYGCYWQLNTRQEEWERMPAGVLKDKAQDFDQRLNQSRYLTLVHGDAKFPNFCWSAEDRASAVDFQYVGRGCGMRDVALFLSRSVAEERRFEEMESWIGLYFEQLGAAISEHSKDVNYENLACEWRPLFSVAWADYLRFRQGWANTTFLSAYDQLQLSRALD